MSDYLSSKSRIRIPDLQEAKRRGEKWAMLTCYDATTARVFDFARLPCVLIGDSAAQAVYGYKSTLPVTLDELIPLARAVASACQRALVVADLPFGSYQESPEQALRSATRFMKEAQVHAVKLEGGAEFAEHVRLLTRSGVPVMAHIGFTPQSEHVLGGYKVQGRGKAIGKLLEDALALQAAGAFACVVELVPNAVASEVRSSLTIPLVGIGAGPDCDAQVLVWNDMAGLSPPVNGPDQAAPSGYLSNAGDQQQSEQRPEAGAEQPKFKLGRAPKFVKRYANLSEVLYSAVLEYMNDVKNGSYPAEEHCYR